jgi:hypothetical protein
MAFGNKQSKFNPLASGLFFRLPSFFRVVISKTLNNLALFGENNRKGEYVYVAEQSDREVPSFLRI